MQDSDIIFTKDNKHFVIQFSYAEELFQNKTFSKHITSFMSFLAHTTCFCSNLSVPLIMIPTINHTFNIFSGNCSASLGGAAYPLLLLNIEKLEMVFELLKKKKKKTPFVTDWHLSGTLSLTGTCFMTEVVAIRPYY